jgi:aminoglycoside phosphotransferase (APT) family kinase protein
VGAPAGGPVVEVVLVHADRAVVRLGDVFVKADLERDRSARELAALMADLCVPVPQLLWHRAGAPHLLALAALPGIPLGRLGEPSPHGAGAWRAAGAAARRLHEQAAPPGLRAPSRYRLQSLDDLTSWLLARADVDPAVIEWHADRARTALAATTASTLVHGDLQAAHVFVDPSTGHVTGILDWSDAGLGDPHHDLAVLTVGHGEHLDDVLEGYGPGPVRWRIEAHWSLRRLGAVRWMVEHGLDASGDLAALARTKTAPSS